MAMLCGGRRWRGGGALGGSAVPCVGRRLGTGRWGGTCALRPCRGGRSCPVMGQGAVRDAVSHPSSCGTAERDRGANGLAAAEGVQLAASRAAVLLSGRSPPCLTVLCRRAPQARR